MKILGYTVARENVITMEWLNAGDLLAIIGNQNYLLTHIEAPGVDIVPKLEPIALPTKYRHIQEGSQMTLLGDKVYVAGFAKEI